MCSSDLVTLCVSVCVCLRAPACRPAAGVRLGRGGPSTGSGSTAALAGSRRRRGAGPAGVSEAGRRLAAPLRRRSPMRKQTQAGAHECRRAPCAPAATTDVPGGRLGAPADSALLSDLGARGPEEGPQRALLDRSSEPEAVDRRLTGAGHQKPPGGGQHPPNHPLCLFCARTLSLSHKYR